MNTESTQVEPNPESTLHRLVRSAYRASGLDLYKWTEALARWPRTLNRPFDYLPLHGVGAEVGVYRGFHARDLLARHPDITELYCVDEYIAYGAINGELPYLADAKRDAERLLSRYGGRVKFIRENSPACARLLPALDFCYLDGSHGFAAMNADLAALWPLIKPGGILGGHDFSPFYTGLIKAVSTFALHEDLELFVWTPDWWVVKPITLGGA